MPASLIFDIKGAVMERKDMPEIKIGKRVIPLYYSTYETIAIQREIGCTAFQLNDRVFGVKTIDEDKDTTLDNIKLTVAEDPASNWLQSFAVVKRPPRGYTDTVKI